MEMSHASRKSVQIAQSVSSGNSAADTLFSQGQRQNHDGSTGSATDPGYSSLRQDTVVSIRSQYDTTNRSLEVLASYFRIPRVGFNAELTNVEDQLGRLRIWAGNIGVNAKEHASLDYRLRDSREAREITVKLLKIVHDHAQQGKYYRPMYEDFSEVYQQSVYARRQMPRLGKSHQTLKISLVMHRWHQPCPRSLRVPIPNRLLRCWN